MKFIVLILAYVLFLPELYSQHTDSLADKINSNKNNIGIGFGLTDFHIRDEIASPLIYRGLGYSVSLMYSRVGDNDEHNVELTAYYTRLRPMYAEYHAENFRAGIRYDYLRQVLKTGKLNNVFRIDAGGGLYTFFNISAYREQYYPDEIMENLDVAWYLTYSVELSALFQYEIKRSNSFEFQIHFPFVSSISRPAYSYVPGPEGNNDFELFGRISPFWENFIVQFKLAYRHKLSDRLSVFIRYDFQYSSYDQPRDVKMYMNNLQAGTCFIF